MSMIESPNELTPSSVRARRNLNPSMNASTKSRSSIRLCVASDIGARCYAAEPARPCCTRKREYRKSDLGSLGYLARHDSRCPDRLAPVDRCPSGSAVSRRHFAGSRLSAERVDVKRVDPMRLSEFERKLSR